MLIELFVLHCWGFLSPAIVPSPTIMPDGPPIVGRSIMSMDLALKKVEDASGGRIAISILLLIPSLDGEDSNSLRKLHDENIDFFLHRFSSRNVTKPVATVTVSLVRTNGRFESGTFLVKI